MPKTGGRSDLIRGCGIGLAIAAALLVPDALAPSAGVLPRALLAGLSAAVVAVVVFWLASRLGAE